MQPPHHEDMTRATGAEEAFSPPMHNFNQNVMSSPNVTLPNEEEREENQNCRLQITTTFINDTKDFWKTSN